MDLGFTNALQTLGANAAFRLIQDARAPQSYLWSQFLPERTVPSYDVKSGSMTVRSTMAGLSGMDSPYPETGTVDVSTFLEQSAKISNTVVLTERVIRTIQDMMMRLQLGGGNTKEAMVEEVLNFTNTLIIQPHLDAMEYLRGRAIVNGAIDWMFNQKRLQVDYGIPSANKLTSRTGTAGYGGSASAFWSDVRSARRLLRYNVRAFVAHPDTIDMILYNTANNLTVVGQNAGTFTVQRIANPNTTGMLSNDQRDTVTLIPYGLEGEIFDITTQGNTTRVPFMPTGKIAALGNNVGTSYQVGAGSRQPVDYELGYTHLAPTVEGNGTPGRWARVYTPESRQWQLIGEGVTNGLPVLEAPEKIVVMTTEMV